MPSSVCRSREKAPVAQEQSREFEAGFEEQLFFFGIRLQLLGFVPFCIVVLLPMAVGRLLGISSVSVVRLVPVVACFNLSPFMIATMGSHLKIVTMYFVWYIRVYFLTCCQLVPSSDVLSFRRLEEHSRKLEEDLQAQWSH